jgi:hypothetical protein
MKLILEETDIIDVKALLDGYGLSESELDTIDAFFYKEREVTDNSVFITGFAHGRQYYYIAESLGLTQGFYDGYGGYFYSDDKKIIFTFAEGDLYLTVFKNNEDYKKEKETTADWYKNEY